METLEGEEAHPVFPVFLVVDVSGSMSGAPIEALSQGLPELKEAVLRDPTVGEIARVGVIAFSDSARSVLDLCDLQYAELPTLSIEGGTNFAAAFRTARSEMERSISNLGKGTRFHKPVLFFLSDGYHNADEDWGPPLQELTDPSFKFNPEVVAFGFGEADRQELGRIATRFAFMAQDADPVNAVRDIMQALIGSIRTTSRSLTEATEGGLTVEADPNRFTPLPVMTLDE